MLPRRLPPYRDTGPAAAPNNERPIFSIHPHRSSMFRCWQVPNPTARLARGSTPESADGTRTGPSAPPRRRAPERPRRSPKQRARRGGGLGCRSPSYRISHRKQNGPRGRTASTRPVRTSSPRGAGPSSSCPFPSSRRIMKESNRWCMTGLSPPRATARPARLMVLPIVMVMAIKR